MSKVDQKQIAESRRLKAVIDGQLRWMYKLWIKNEPNLKKWQKLKIGEDLDWDFEDVQNTRQKEFIDAILKVMVEFQTTQTLRINNETRKQESI